MNLNPLIAKQKPNGNVQCLVCNAEVKAKIWTAHVNGKKHRESIERLRTSSTQKRGQPEHATTRSAHEPPSKRTKEDVALPSDFFDDAESSTPFRSDESKTSSTSNAPSHLIEGVPAGFFDDKRLDGKLLETRERNAELDAEFERFKEEIGDEQTDQEAKRDESEAAGQRELELERIDEQMAALRRLNELEIQKERRLNMARERRAKRMEEEEAEEAKDRKDQDDDPETDFDLDALDWRAKNIFN